MTLESSPLQFSNEQLRPIATALSVIVGHNPAGFTPVVEFDQGLAGETLDSARRLNAIYEESQLPGQSVLNVRRELIPALMIGLGFVRDTIESELPRQRFWADRRVRREMQRSLKTIAGITGAIALAE